MKVIVGIDPGLKGGLAFYDGKTLIVYPTPVNSVRFVKNGKKKKRDEMDLAQAVFLMRQHGATQAFLEQVTAMPGQGVTGMFRFGTNYGQWLGMLAGLDIPVTTVTPQKWKKDAGLTAEKNDSLELARTLFPDNLARFKLKKNDGLAEASLIARYGYRSLESTIDLS